MCAIHYPWNFLRVSLLTMSVECLAVSLRLVGGNVHTNLFVSLCVWLSIQMSDVLLLMPVFLFFMKTSFRIKKKKLHVYRCFAC